MGEHDAEELIWAEAGSEHLGHDRNVGRPSMADRHPDSCPAVKVDRDWLDGAALEEG